MDEHVGYDDNDGLNSLFTSGDTAEDPLYVDEYSGDNPVSPGIEPGIESGIDPSVDYADDSAVDVPDLGDVPDLAEDEEVQLTDPSAELDAPPPAPESDAPEEDGVYGSAHEWNSDWFYQQVDGYCGPTSAAIIINEYHDAGIADPEYMVNQAYELGLTDDISQGMYMRDVQTLLEASGVPCENVNSSMSDLAQRLEDGYGVIAFVDAGEVWGLPEDATTEDDRSDHFLVVTEINTNTGMVTLADPGSPDGNGMQIPISEFEDAWADSNYEMIATTAADPELGGAINENQQLAIANVTRSDVIQ